jgi:hypothetical protein
MSANSNRIEKIRDSTGNDAESLALLFSDSFIKDDGSVNGRLRAILEATEKTGVPGLQTGIKFSDSGFRDDFKDPWPDSANQVGHFLTAVGLSFNPAKVAQSFMGRRLRDWLGADGSLTDEAVALRLTIGHEKAPDPTMGTKVGGAIVGGIVGGVVAPWSGLAGPAGGAAAGAGIAILRKFRDQFAACTSADVQVFQDALRSLGTGSPLDLDTAKAKLRSIRVDESLSGNSYADLLLSLFGWRLGQDILAGKFAAGADVATWIRTNIKK